MSDRHKQIVRGYLETIGYTIEEIPEGKELSADLAAAGSDAGLVVEVKARREDLSLVRDLSATPPLQVIESHAPIVHDDYLSDLVHKAAKQIQCSQKLYPGLGMLWFRSDPELGICLATHKMVTTLLGRRYVHVRKSDGFITSAACYLAARADFFRYKGIDLAFVEDPDGEGQLLTNPYSPRLEQARACRLYTFTAATKPGAIIDIQREAESGVDYILFGDFQRGDEAAVLAELKRRYPDRDFQIFDMQSHTGYTRA
jgi:hypothetical protein